MPSRIPTSVLPRANPTAEGTEDPPASLIPRTFIGSNIINNNSAFAAASLIDRIHSSPQQPSLFTTFEEPPILETGLHYGDSGDEKRKTVGHRQRADQDIAAVANWLSLIGSLLIIFHIPRVTRHVPSQKKRMLIILFTAFSNTGFALANIITEYTNAVTKLPCTFSAWCYVFFQLLTCTLVIVSTFRLCGVFVFHRRRSVPSKYIAICPAIAFLLSTPAAISGNFDFDECGHYCWFKLVPDQQDCKIRSLWAWLSFYGWMLLFIAILFASTLFVMVKIILSVTHSRSNLKQVVNQATLEFIMIDSPSPQSSPSTSIFQKLRSMSHSFQARITSIFSFGGRRREAVGTTGSAGSAPGRAREGEVGAGTGTGAIPGKGSAENRQEHQQQQPITNFHPNLEGVVLPTPAELAALASPPPSTDVSVQIPLRDTLAYHGSRSRSTSPTVPQSSFPAQEVGTLGRKERSFVVAILRQALYPISISLSGCIQIFVDLTIPKVWDQDDEFSYAATVATSIQGFLFFLVFLFDPAVIQTRREWRKYMVWRYYIEFYYSLEMPHEGREFETRFMQQCQELDPVKDQAKLDQLTRPPSYSWSLQYDSLAMPTDFQTSYPLSAAINATPTNAEAAGGMTQGTESAKPIPTTTTRSIQLGGEANAKGSTHTTLPVHTAEVDRTELTNPTTFSRPTPTITIMEPKAGGGKDPMVKTMAEYTRTTSDPTSETSASTTATTTYTTTTTTSGTSSTDTDTAATPAKDEEIRDHPRPRLTTLEALNSAYQSASSINTFRDHDILPQNDQVYLDKDMATDRNVNARRMIRNREAILKAPYAGDDILSFPRLSRVTTIGGGTGVSNGRAPRRYRNSAKMMMGSATSHNATVDSTTLSRTSAGTAGPTNEKRRSFGESLLLFIQGGHWHSGTAEERYHTRFRYPRLAYLIHRVVRVVYIPKKARLPPIPNPPRNNGADCEDFGAYDAYDDDPEQASCSTSPPQGRSRPWDSR
ncbi:hypothetical protein BG015_002296 [Linnemannia schmuckeri]|uniref:G-protein coupled receptors family 2 profile 2 domain-containing protein n=1 Tax=Linnemannia schmuckeri TaxID=64567 RepID=A0A9P5VD67_9FUNG|nr:hypothetical protein BG015_002296 [Linnemannia schmuckeri]